MSDQLDTDAIRKAFTGGQIIGTHYEGCETVHRECAIAKLCDEIDRLRDEVARFKREILACGPLKEDGERDGFDWAVLERLDRLEAAEEEREELRAALIEIAEAQPAEIFGLPDAMMIARAALKGE